LRKIFFERLKKPAATETCGIPRHDQSLLDVMAIRAQGMPRDEGHFFSKIGNKPDDGSLKPSSLE
jgi:hypothetical protein